MKTIRVKGLGELRRALRKNLRDKERRMERARIRAAKRGAAHVRTHIPVAFGELRAGVKVIDGKIVVDARHAAAVERGSRPHWMPLEPLIKWVKLRGFQGLATEKRIGRMPGTTTASHARNAAAAIRAAGSRGGYEGENDGVTTWGSSDRRSDTNAPVEVAKAIQLAIALKGTKPHWYMRDSVPVVRGFLAEEIRKELGRD